MFSFLSKQYRRARRERIYQAHIARLCHIQSVPAKGKDGTVVAVMMSRKPDAQRGSYVTDTLNYMKPWLNSVNATGLRGVVLHDGLPDSVIDEASTEHIRFERCGTSSLPILYHRHLAALDYLSTLSDPLVLITDISDVAFRRDPFEIIKSQAEKKRLFIGSELKTLGKTRCLMNDMTEQYGKAEFRDRLVVNPGILGGKVSDVMDFLRFLIAEIEAKQATLITSDMAMINMVFHRNYSIADVVTGMPLHSRFRKWEYSTDAAIIHK
jgi:hypothetical protein